jgi:hypothetical protein
VTASLRSIEPLATLGVDVDPDQLRTLFWDEALHNAVVCTQGETIGRLLTELVAKALVVEDPLDGPPPPTGVTPGGSARRATLRANGQAAKEVSGSA